MPAPDPPKLSAASLLAAVGDWRADGRPAFRALAAAVAGAAERGDVPPGALLPPERRLAESLGVSRGTVVAAYDVLRSDGVVLRRQGSGTWLPANGVPAEAWTPDDDAGLRARRLAARVVHPLDGVIDLGISALDRPCGLPPDGLRLDLGDLIAAGGGHGYQPNGVPALRAAVAARYSAAGWPTDASQVAITLGTQHAIGLAARLLLHPGDGVAIESPSYPGAIDVLARAGAHFATVATDRGGARVDQLARLAADGSLRLAYLVPTCHNPAGTVLPDHRRREVAAIVDAHPDLWLVEDETLAPLRFDGPPPLPIAAHGRSDRYLVCGSLAKVTWGGLRVGWIRTSAATVSRLGRLRAALDLGGSTVAQLVALRCFDGLDDSVTALRAELAGQAATMLALLHERLPSWRCTPPAGGLSLWCQLPAGVSGDHLAAGGLAHGVSVLPGSAASVDEMHLDFVRLCFAHPPEVLDEAVTRLTTAWESR